MEFNIVNTNKERSLAHVEEITNITPILGADRIAMAQILGWRCIVNKEEFSIGDKCIYFEIDSLVNKEDERFAFLEKKNYKVKTMKLGKFNVISQGLAMPLSEFPELGDLPVGTDVTKKLKVTYYDPEDQKRKANTVDPNAKYKSMASRHPEIFRKRLVRWLMRREWGKKLLFVFFGKKKDNPRGFPSHFVKKTDEERVENMPWILESKNNKYSVTEKCLSSRMIVRTDKGNIRIGKIVNQNMDVLVATYNEDKRCVEYKPVINKYKIKSDNVKAHYKIGVAYRGKCAGRQKYIECTEDHQIFANDKWIEASDLKVGDKLAHYAEKIPIEPFQMIIGSLLGDAHINHKESYITVEFSHCIDQAEYVEYKRKLLGKYACSDHKRVSGYGSQMKGFVVSSNLYINKYITNNCMTENGKKIVTKQWCDDLTPISLAFWYMDDGSLSNRNNNSLGERIHIATNSFSMEECRLLQDALKNKFGINSSIHNKPCYKGNVISLGVEDTRKFACLIAPYVCDCMKYKLPKKYEKMKCIYDNYQPIYEDGILESKVISIEKFQPKKFGTYMYDIETENHNYFAQGILVHNCDGTSTTFALEKKKKDYDFIVCSRNVRQKDRDQECYHESNVYWEMADKYAIEQKLRMFAKKNNVDKMYLQGETVGEKLQGNPYHMGVRNFYAFNLWVDGKRYTNEELFEWCDQYCIPHVPLIYEHHQLPDNMEDMKAEADGMSEINPSVMREGLVYRDEFDPYISFKNVSNNYLTKKGD